MKVEVRYYSRGGNTKRLAEAVAKALDCPTRTEEVQSTSSCHTISFPHTSHGISSTHHSLSLLQTVSIWTSLMLKTSSRQCCLTQ